MPESTSGSHPGAATREHLQERAVRGTLWTGIHTVVSLPLAFVVNLVVARVLGVVDYGRLSYLTTLIDMAATIATMGVATALVQFGAKAHAAGRRDEVRRLLSGVQGYRLFVVMPVVIVVVLLAARLDPGLMLLAVAFGIVLPASLGGASDSLGIENRADSDAKLAMVGNLLTQAAVLAAVFAVGTADSIWAARVVVGGLVVALAMLAVSTDYRRAVVRPRSPRTLPADFWRFAVPTGLASVVATLVVSRTEVFFLAALADPVEVGLFALAFGLASHVYAPAQSFVGPLIPAVSGLSEVDRPAVGRAFLRTLRAGSAVLSVFMGVALPAFAALVPLLYGAEYAPAAKMLLALGLAGAAGVVAAPVQAFLMARLGGRRILVINLAALGVNVGLALALIPTLGAWGAVVANVAGTAARTVPLVVGEVRHLGLRWGAVIHDTGSLAVGGLACAAGWAVPTVTGWGGPGGAAAAGLTGAVVLAPAIKLGRLGLTPADRSAILGALPGRLQRLGGLCLWFLTARARAAR